MKDFYDEMMSSMRGFKLSFLRAYTKKKRFSEEDIEASLKRCEANERFDVAGDIAFAAGWYGLAAEYYTQAGDLGSAGVARARSDVDMGYLKDAHKGIADIIKVPGKDYPVRIHLKIESDIAPVDCAHRHTKISEQ